MTTAIAPEITGLLEAADLEELENQHLATLADNPEAPVEIPGLTLPEVVASLRRIRYHRGRIEEIKAMAEALKAPLLAELKRIEEWASGEMDRPTKSIAFHQSRVTAYARLNPPTKGKTLSLPGGKVSFRTTDKWTYGDEQTLLALVSMEAPNLIRVKEEVNKADLKKVAVVADGRAYLADANGELHELPITVTPETTYTVDVE